MFRIPPPPEPPSDSQQWLEQLAIYYKQLVDYHHQAAQTAARQLAHLEILLGGVTEQRNQTIIERPAIGQLSPSQPNSPTELTSQIAALLATEKGHAVQIDYIVRKLYGILESENLNSITAWVKMALITGEKESKWSAVPDAPECWTLNLQELTTSSNREPSSKTTLTTREVAQLLQTSPKVIIRNKNKYAEQFTEGTHYLVDEQNWYYWTSSGIDLLKSLLEEANPPRKKLDNDGQPSSQQINHDTERLNKKGCPSLSSLYCTLSQPSKRLSKIDKPQRLPPYHEFNLMDSIKKLLFERMGQVLSIDEVCQALYGEVPPTQYTRIRTQVAKYLSKGKQQGDWVAVPDQKSHYTWEYNIN